MSLGWRSTLLLIGLAGALDSRAIQAQRATLQVIVITTDSTPLPGAEIVLTGSDIPESVSARANRSGEQLFTFDIVERQQVVVTVRHLGYVAAVRELMLDPGERRLIKVQLANSLPSLAPMTTTGTAAGSVLDSSQIASSGRIVANADDAIRKLNPDMLGDRGRLCSRVSNVWINDVRIWSEAAPRYERTAGSPIVYLRRAPGPSLDEILRSVRAEDIAMIRYTGCRNTSDPRMGSNDAIFITLKAGCSWTLKTGSVGAPTAPADRAPANSKGASEVFGRAVATALAS